METKVLRYRNAGIFFEMTYSTSDFYILLTDTLIYA